MPVTDRRRRKTVSIYRIPKRLEAELEAIERELNSLAGARACGILTAEELCKLAVLEDRFRSAEAHALSAPGGRFVRVPLASLPREPELRIPGGVRIFPRGGFETDRKSVV